MLVDLPVKEFLDRLKSHQPTPGGGSAAALAGAVAASLAAMVVELTVRSEKHAASHAALGPIGRRATELLGILTSLVDRDAEAYDAVVAANRLPKGTPEEKEARSAARRQALRLATDTPLRTAEAAAETLDCAAEALEAGINPNAASDLGVAALLAHAALRAAAMNVEINLPGLKDLSYAGEVHGRLNTLFEESDRRREGVLSEVERLLGRQA